MCGASLEAPLLRASSEALPLPGDFRSRTSSEVLHWASTEALVGAEGSSGLVAEGHGAIEIAIGLPELLSKLQEPLPKLLSKL